MRPIYVISILYRRWMGTLWPFCCLIPAAEKECWYDAALGPVMSIAAFVLAHWGLLYLPLRTAAPPLSFVKPQTNYFLPIHHRPIRGGRRAKCGSELGSNGDTKQKDVDSDRCCGVRLRPTLSDRRAFDRRIDRLWVFSRLWCTQIIRIQFSGFEQ